MFGIMWWPSDNNISKKIIIIITDYLDKVLIFELVIFNSYSTFSKIGIFLLLTHHKTKTEVGHCGIAKMLK